ncbi:MAG: arginine decarboxylase, partial [Gemmatimonadaceae bacterium]
MAATPTSDAVAASPAPAANGVSVTPWSIDRAKALYNIEGWGDGFFDVNAAGRVVVRPDRDRPEQTLDLYELAHDLEAQGVNLPVLLRFSEILKARIEMLHARFAAAIAEFQYTGNYTT